MKFHNPTCSSQNHTAVTMPCVPLSLHLDFSFLLILRPPLTPSHTHCDGNPCLPQPVSPPCFQGSSGGGLVGQCFKVYSVRECPRPSHALTTLSLTHPEPLPALQAPLVVSALYNCTILKKSFIAYFYCTPYICFDMFRYTDTIVLQLL